MRLVELIEQKKRGKPLSTQQIEWMIASFVKGEIPDYQMSAMLMAIRFVGMDDRETADLTQVMMCSGDVADLSDIDGIKVDKHSTGGVGDTTTLVLAPLVAACGVKVAKMSGRGLGHTGGTLDKLESIPGFCVEIPIDRFKRQVSEIGLAVIGQTGNLVPADKLIYALRDVTGTVDSLPLIASSIMSKKLASGADAIVLDVKFGSGALMEKMEEAQKLADLMVQIGQRLGRKVEAVITDMSEPLGRAVGNALEIKEAVELLSGNIKEEEPLYKVCLELGTHMLLLGGAAADEADAAQKLKQAVTSGAGLKKLKEMVRAQGGDDKYIDVNKIDELCSVKKKIPVCAEFSGAIISVDTAGLGRAAQMLGAGRETKADTIDPAVGFVMHKRVGEPVQMGETLCTLYVNDESRVGEAAALVLRSILIEKVEA